MEKFESPLSNLKVASPCPADWNAMTGDARKRFCGDCKLNVYNLSGMTRYDAENLLRLSEGRLCVRYFQRADGTVLTADCPVGWAKVRQRLSVAATAAFALLISLCGGLLAVATLGRKTDIGYKLPIPFVTPTPKYAVMGAIEMPTPTASPTPRKVREVIGKMRPADEKIRREVERAAGSEKGKGEPAGPPSK